MLLRIGIRRCLLASPRNAWAVIFTPCGAVGSRVWNRFCSTSSTENVSEMPVYDGNANAAEVFGNPYFYDGDSTRAKLFAPIRQYLLGDLTVHEVGYYWDAGHPAYDADALAVDFFAKSYFYRGRRSTAELYAPVRQEKFGSRTVGEVMQQLGSTRKYFEKFQSVGIPREAVAPFRRALPSDNFKYVPSCHGDAKAKDFFADCFFYYGSEYTAGIYSVARNHWFGDKSVFDVTGPCESYEDLNRVFKPVGIDIGVQILQYHPHYANIFSSSFFRVANLAHEECDP
jgi:hypothetical protein